MRIFRSYSTISLLIWIGFVITLPIDMVTGFALNSGLSFTQLSVGLKGTLVALIILFLLIHKPSFAVIILASVTLLLLSQFYHSMTNNLQSLEPSINLIKIIFPFMVLMFVFAEYDYHKSKGTELELQNKVLSVINIYVIVFILNMIIGLLGFGFSTYRNDIGISGMFYAGNEVSGLFIVLAGYTLAIFRIGISKFYWPISIIVFIMGLAIGTKSAIIGALILISLVGVLGGRKKIFTPATSGIILFLAAGLVFVIIKAQDILVAANLWDKFVHIYESRGLLGLIFSNRNVHLAESFLALTNLDSVGVFIFGLGQHGLEEHTGKGSIEMDPFDLYFWFGFAGIMVFIAWLAILIKLCFRVLKDKGQYSRCILLLFLCLIAMSFLSGHILISGMVGIPIALVISSALLNYRANYE